MGLYDYNLDEATIELLPPQKRDTTNLAFLGVFGAKLQYLHDLFFNEYAGGSTASNWQPSISYSYQTRKKYIDNAVYEVINFNGINSSVPPPNDPANWAKVLNTWIGARERARYNSQRLIFEFALNKWFKTVFRQPTSWDSNGNITPLSDIYINNNAISNSFFFGATAAESSFIPKTASEQRSFINYSTIINRNSFTINVPIAVYNALGANNSIRDKAIKDFADDYVLAGLYYNILTY
jgi:hypothetical protein